MEVSTHHFNLMQFNLQNALDDIVRLKARVTALEGGEALPPEQSIAPESQSVTGEEVLAVHQPAAAQPETPTELPDISQGWVGGGRR